MFQYEQNRTVHDFAAGAGIGLLRPRGLPCHEQRRHFHGQKLAVGLADQVHDQVKRSFCAPWRIVRCWIFQVSIKVVVA